MTVPHPEPLSGTSYSAMELLPGNDCMVVLDQRKLPAEETYVSVRTAEDTERVIREMVVRGAPAIGITAAYGLVLAARSATGSGWLDELARAGELLKGARPTAVNLFWAVDRMLRFARELDVEPGARVDALAAEARAIHRDDVAANRRMGRAGAELLPDEGTVLTHCNAGALATGGYGTALGVIRAARDAGKRIKVLADETRPYLQGARLTVWELARDGIDVELITDSSAGYFIGRGEVDAAVVGSDRIAVNGDVANKIGTFTVATMLGAHERPFYVAAPWSTVDEACPSGAQIVIEQRDEREVTHVGGVRLAPEGVRARNPAFDVTPARLVSAIITERGVAKPVGEPEIRRLASLGWRGSS